MKHALVIAVFAVPAFLAAQKPDATPRVANPEVTTYSATLDSAGNAKTFSVLTQHSACPVSMQAKQGSGAGLIAVKRQPGQPDDTTELNRRLNQPGQHIHLILGRMSWAQFSDEPITSATVTARGLSARARLDSSTDTIGVPTGDLHRTMDVRFTADDDGGVYADLDLRGFTSVQSIRIDSIALKDGSKWTFDTQAACSVTPDPLMLIANQ